jgi:hypothetical protein
MHRFRQVPFVLNGARRSPRLPPNWIGWSPTSSNTRFQSPRDAGLTASQIPNLKLKWAFGFRGDILAFGALTIQSGTLFTGRIYKKPNQLEHEPREERFTGFLLDRHFVIEDAETDRLRA